MFKDTKNLIYFLKYFLALYLTLNIFMLVVNGIYSSYKPFDFRLLKNEYVIDTKSLDRKSIQKIKLAYIENFEAVDLGLFSNHIVQNYSKDDNLDIIQNDTFFNFWYANLSLTEVHHLLIYLDKIGKLPKKILIGITTPNNDMGGCIIRYRGELPLYIMSFNKVFTDLKNNFSEFFSFIKSYFSPNIFFVNTDYMRIYQTLYELYLRQNIDKWDISDKMVHVKDCRDTSIVKRLTSNCYLALKYDGSTVPKYYNYIEPIKFGNSNTLPTKLSISDEKIIVHQINVINSFLKEKNRKVVFFIPPVYEDERDTVAKKIFDSSLDKLNNDVKILDHRFLRGDKSYFDTFDHASNKYFKFLLKDIISKYNYKF